MPEQMWDALRYCVKIGWTFFIISWFIRWMYKFSKGSDSIPEIVGRFFRDHFGKKK